MENPEVKWAYRVVTMGAYTKTGAEAADAQVAPSPHAAEYARAIAKAIAAVEPDVKVVIYRAGQARPWEAYIGTQSTHVVVTATTIR